MTRAPVVLLHGWPGSRHDYEAVPLYPARWSDRIDDFFADVELRLLAGVGHFTPLEAAPAFAEAIRERCEA